MSVKIIEDDDGITKPSDPRELQDRRDWHRYRTLESRASISWKEANGICRNWAVTLLNISGGGAALIIIKEVPPRKGTICFRLDAVTDEWVEARVVKISSMEPERYLVQLEFLTPCPDHMFTVSVHGRGMV